MGLLEKIFPQKTAEAQVYSWFQTLGGYTPIYTSFEGGVYEMALTRACTTRARSSPLPSSPASSTPT